MDVDDLVRVGQSEYVRAVLEVFVVISETLAAYLLLIESKSENQ